MAESLLYFLVNSLFLVSVYAECGGEISEKSGLFVYPADGSSYPTNVDCTWTFTSGVSKALSITYNIENTNDCAADSLEISDPYETLGRICGNSVNSYLGVSLRIRFRSDGNDNGASGFHLQHDEGCGGMLTSVPVIVTSPGYPVGYPLNLRCRWIIDAGEEVQMFLIFRFENSCGGDYLKVFTDSGEEIKHACGTDFSGMSWTRDVFKLQFYSDDTSVGDGFWARFTSTAVTNAEATTAPMTTSSTAPPTTTITTTIPSTVPPTTTTATTTITTPSTSTTATTSIISTVPLSTQESTTGIITVDVSAADRIYIVNKHNEWRSSVVFGVTSPRAGYMNRIVWSNELATRAQLWAEECTYTQQSIPERYFKATGLGLGYPLLYGQNLHKGAEENQSWKGVLEKWYDERHNFAYGEYSPGAKHYIQMMFDDALFLGCGFKQCTGYRYYVCNYIEEYFSYSFAGDAPWIWWKPTCDTRARCSNCDNGLCAYSNQ
ncbi:hypothetical protein ScPMuIL_011017 [Solemya velum]